MIWTFFFWSRWRYGCLLGDIISVLSVLFYFVVHHQLRYRSYYFFIECFVIVFSLFSSCVLNRSTCFESVISCNMWLCLGRRTFQRFELKSFECIWALTSCFILSNESNISLVLGCLRKWESGFRSQPLSPPSVFSPHPVFFFFYGCVICGLCGISCSQQLFQIQFNLFGDFPLISFPDHK